MKKSLGSVLMICFTSFAAVPRAQADVVAWLNSDGGKWSNPTNWSGGIVPREADSVSIILDGVYTVTMDVDAAIAGLTLGGANGTQTLANANRRLTLNGRSAVNPNGVLSHSGKLTQADILEVSGIIKWTSGTLSAGTLSIAPSGSLEISGSAAKTLESATIENAGTLTWTGGGIFGDGLAAINNLASGIFEIRSSPGLAGATLSNYGVIRKVGEGLTTLGNNELQLEFYNGGKVDIQRGALGIVGNGSASGGVAIAKGAGFYLSSSQGFTLDLQSSVSGEGDVTFEGSVNVNGKLSVSGQAAFPGTPVFSGQFTLPLIIAGSMGGDGHVIVTKQLDWITPVLITFTMGLRLSDSLSVTVAKNAFARLGVLEIKGENTVENFGIAEISHIGELNFPDNAGIINQEGALLTLTNENSNSGTSLGVFTLTNAGTVRKSGVAGRFALQANFQNTGAVEVDRGEIWVLGDYVHASTGSLTITLQQAGEERFTCDGHATLAGNFKLVLADSLVPNVGDRYELCAFGSRTGEFGAVEAWKAGRRFDVEPRYEGNKFVLVVKSVPALEPVRLSIARVGDQVAIAWPEGLAAKLQATASLLAAWVDVATETNRVVLPADQPAQFFRLLGAAP